MTWKSKLMQFYIFSMYIYDHVVILFFTSKLSFIYQTNQWFNIILSPICVENIYATHECFMMLYSVFLNFKVLCWIKLHVFYKRSVYVMQGYPHNGLL